VEQRHASKGRESRSVFGYPCLIDSLVTADGWPNKVLNAINVVFAHDNADARTASSGEKY
jgi:hypothetical protein